MSGFFRRHWLSLTVITLVVAALYYVGVDHFSSARRLLEAKYGRIGEGMTAGEVEALLGPPDAEESRLVAHAMMPGADGERPFCVGIVHIEKQWVKSAGVVVIEFNNGEQVVARKLVPEPSLLDRLRAWLGL